MIPVFSGEIINCKLVLNDKDSFDRYGESLNGKKIELVLREKKNRRSLNQNSYYWGVVIKLIVDYSGHSPDEIHELMKSIFLKKYVDIKIKKEVQSFAIIKSTTTLNTDKMEEYLFNIRMWAQTNLSINIPLPNEVEY